MITIKLPDGDEVSNEVKTFVHKRYISATFAHWRIQEYDLVRMIPTVMQLRVHDLGQHEVYFQPNENSIRHEVNNGSTTMLTEFFATNACPL